MAINIPIISSLGGKGFEQAILQLKQLETNGQKAGFVLEKAFVPAIAALGALAVAGGFAVKAAIEDQESQVQLAQALKNTVGASDEVIAATETMITQMSRASGVADDELRPAFAQLVRGTGSLTKAQEAMTLAMDIQAGTGQDLRAVTDALAAAYAGNLKGLKGLSPEITKMIRDGAGLSEVVKVLGNNFKGAADVAGKSAKGQLALMNGAFTDMKESLGLALLPALEAVIPMLVKFSDWAANHVNVVIAIGTGIAGIATAIATYVAVQKAANAVMIVATALNWAMAASETAKNTAMTLGVGAAAIAAGLVVAMGALTIFKNKTKDLTAAQVEQNNVGKETNSRLGSTSELLFGSNAMQLKAAYATAYTTEKIKEQDKGLGGLSDTTKKAADKLKELKKAAEDAAQTLREETAKAVKEAADTLNQDLLESLDKAKTGLMDAREAFNDFGKSVSDGIKSAFSFADAKEAGDETGAGFLQGLRDQVQGIITYGTDVETLLKRGLSQESLQAVLAAGGESGAAIAHELVLGAQENITGPEGVNALVKSANDVANRIGLNAAAQWYGAGVTSAQEYLKGVEDAFAVAQSRLNAAGSGLTLADVKGIGAGFFDQVQNGYTATPLEQFQQDGGGLSMGAGGNIVYNINVSGVMSNAQTGEEIVNNIRAFNRAAGPANISVA